MFTLKTNLKIKVWKVHVASRVQENNIFLYLEEPNKVKELVLKTTHL